MTRITEDDMAQRDRLKQAEKLAANFDPDGMFELAKMYENPPACGWIEKDLDEALWYYKGSVWEAYKQRKRYCFSACNAGRLLYVGTPKEQDTEIAYHYFKYAADAGSSHAMYLLGCYHVGRKPMDKGCGFERMPVLGVRYLTAAANNGHVNAMFELSLCYNDGRGVVRDEWTACDWEVRAAQKGHVGAMYNAGVSFEKQYNFKQAGYWFNEAAQHGDQNAKRAMQKYVWSKFSDCWKHVD